MSCALSVSSVLIFVLCVCVGQTWHLLADSKVIFLPGYLERDFAALWKLQNGKVLISVHLAFSGVKVKFRLCQIMKS